MELRLSISLILTIYLSLTFIYSLLFFKGKTEKLPKFYKNWKW